MKKKIALLVAALIVIGASFVSIKYYSYVFAKSVKGKVVGVERVTQNTAIIQNADAGNALPNQIFSFAVAIQDDKGQIFTASSEDRQWAVVVKGQCAEAKFFPYPPWDLAKANTFFGARLEKLSECN